MDAPPCISTRKTFLNLGRDLGRIEIGSDEAQTAAFGANICTDRESRGDADDEGFRVAGPKTGPDAAGVGSSESFRSFFNRDTA